MIGRTIRVAACVVFCTSSLVGCFQSSRPLRYLHDDEPVQHYREYATEIVQPRVHTRTTEEVSISGEPRTLRDRSRDEIWDLTLAEAVQIALRNNDVIRVNGTFRSSGNGILANPDNTPTTLDPAIQESNVLFGARGVEAALSSFDTTFTTTMVWGRDELLQNSLLTPAGTTAVSESGAFTAGLSKQFANGGTLTLSHDMTYLGVAPGTALFPSSYTGSLGLDYRLPLWAGSGVEYTRIAGPLTPGLGAITGVGQGVVIARINQDLQLADFEVAARDLVRDVETLYWDLYLQYRLYNTAVVARNSALTSWRRTKSIIDVGGAENVTPADEAQARDQYYANRAATENTLAQVYSLETQLRRLLGLPVNDGRIIRPADEPQTAPLNPEWYAALTEALTRRVELRRQKWNVRSLELQLGAAQSLVAPSLDFVSGYNVNAFGDQLLGYDDDDAVGSPQGMRYAYETLTQGNQTGWTLGLEFSMPLGFRFANSQVRNLELRLTKARRVLATQELEISHELAVAFQNLYRYYQTAKTNYNRGAAARERLEKFEEEEKAGTRTLDDVLRAQVSVAEAERDYYTSLVEYNKGITDLLYRKGALLAENNVVLAEGGWQPEAYELAMRRARARTHAISADEDFVATEPRELVHPMFAQEVELVGPPNELRPMPDAMDNLQRAAEAADAAGAPLAPPITVPEPAGRVKEQ